MASLGGLARKIRFTIIKRDVSFEMVIRVEGKDLPNPPLAEKNGLAFLFVPQLNHQSTRRNMLISNLSQFGKIVENFHHLLYLSSSQIYTQSSPNGSTVPKFSIFSILSILTLVYSLAIIGPQFGPIKEFQIDNTETSTKRFEDSHYWNLDIGGLPPTGWVGAHALITFSRHLKDDADDEKCFTYRGSSGICCDQC